jgi:phosphotransferase system enzyme I (PtsI)
LNHTKEIRLKGLPISSGIAIGHSFFVQDELNVFKEVSIDADNVNAEISRFQIAVKNSMKDITVLKKQLESENVKEAVDIMEAQLQLLSDPVLIGDVEKQIHSKRKNAEFILQSIVKSYEKKFQEIKDPYFKERFKDLEDISHRIFSYLRKGIKQYLPERAKNSVLFIDDLSPSQTAEASKKNVCAIVTERGSAIAHAAILARAKSIPFMTNIPVSKLLSHAQSCVIVDGKKGELIINPSEKTLNRYKKLCLDLSNRAASLKANEGGSVKTSDGHPIEIFANLETLDEVDLVEKYGGKGIGLFRTENILIGLNKIPSEKEQFAIYKQLVEKMRGAPTTIRVFDVNGDKAGVEGHPDASSIYFLGFKAIRNNEKERQIYKTQLKAICKASAYGPVNILFPLISSVEEFLEAKKLALEALKNVKSLKKVNFGCMIELPSAAIISDLLAQHCDFLSIGTNDLVQHTLAVDRCDYALSHLYEPAHPCVLRLIQRVIQEANRTKIPLSVCGEIASNPKFIPLLIGMGIKQLSVAARYIPLIRQTIKGVDMAECKKLAEQALSLISVDEIKQLLERQFKNHSHKATIEALL